MTFTEAVAEVVDMTKRPDKVQSINRAINAALSFIATEGNFARDTDEVAVDFATLTLDPSATIHSIPLGTFPRFRKFTYIRPNNRNSYLCHKGADFVFQDNVEKLDVFYITGDSLQLKLKAPSPGLIVGYFRNAPVMTASSPQYWLLEDSPYMVLHKAAALVFSEVGNTTETAKQEQLFALAFISAQRDFKYGINLG